MISKKKTYVRREVVAQNLARLIVERHNLLPPVPIDELLALRADIEEVSWPFPEVDAVVVGLGRSIRPKVFYRSGVNIHRLRFTLGHELGHIVMQWHLGVEVCSSGDGRLDLTRYTDEDQADIFSSCLLLPEYWLKDLVRSHPHPAQINDLISGIEIAEVSRHASLLALRRVLTPGWLFFLPGNGGWVASPATEIPGGWTLNLDENIVRAAAFEFGTAPLHGAPVRWYRMFPASDMPNIADEIRPATEVLLAALAHVYPTGEWQKMQNSLSGKAGGDLRQSNGRSALELFHLLEYTFGLRYEELMLQPEFMMWLALRAAAKAEP